MAGSKDVIFRRKAARSEFNKPIADANCTITALVAKTRPCTSGATFASQDRLVGTAEDGEIERRTKLSGNPDRKRLTESKDYFTQARACHAEQKAPDLAFGTAPNSVLLMLLKTPPAPGG